MPYPIGIDLGTTNSVGCVYRRGMVETMPVDGRTTMPSVISVLPDGVVKVGNEAKRRAMIEPFTSITSVKRHIGDGKTKWEIQSKVYTPKSVSTLIIKRIKSAAEQFLKGPVTEAVITVPAYFDNNQRSETKRAGEEAGLRVLQLLPEPTAAAISYGLDQGKDQMLLVYDLGGGTFDVSVLRVKGNRFEVVAVDGDYNLGGDDFDLLLVEHLIGLLQKRTQTDLSVLRSLFGRKRRRKEREDETEMLLARQKLKEAAEMAKIELSQSDTTLVSLPEILGTTLEEEITIDTYNGMIEPLVTRTTDLIRDVLRSARLSADDIDRVILVGGSTRNRLVKERVAAELKEPYTSDRVDEVVAQGAAIVAGYMSAPDIDMLPMEFSNVTPFSLGVCSFDRQQARYVNSVIIQRNSPVPCVEARPYELQTRPGDDNVMEVYMLQGENQDPAKCLLLGKYVFKGVSHVATAMPKVEIEYGYDESGIITAAAKDLGTGRALQLSVEPLPDDMSWLSGPPETEQFDPASLRLMATRPGYDDVGAVLRQLELPFEVYTAGGKLDCDIFFWNCLAGTHPTALEVRSYVHDGGCLYASCCVAKELGEVFGKALGFSHAGCRSEVITADVVDEELKRVLGTRLRIEYNTAACYSVGRMGPDSKVLLREAVSGLHVMVMAPYGKGHVFYTTFHHHKNLSEPEKKLLQLLVMKQISVVSGIPIEVVSRKISG